MKHLAFALLAYLPCSLHAIADEPLPPPNRHTACSPSLKFCASSDPATATTTQHAKGSSKALWTIPAWHRWLLVSDDGESLVAGYDGMNLAQVDVTLKEPMFTFYHRGRLVRRVTLGELYRHKSQLQRTVSHLAWMRVAAFNGANQFVVELVDERKIAFDPRTGRQVALSR